jgi:hypothetical protein
VNGAASRLLGSVAFGLVLLSAGVSCRWSEALDRTGIDRVDQLVYGAQDLEGAIDHLEAVLGVRAVYGGQHPGQGTHNALLSLGPAVYLEILAPDPAQPDPVGQRWFGIDAVTTPRLVTWAAKEHDL